MNPFKYIDKLVKSQYSHFDGYTLKFKYHILIIRFIVVLPFWFLRLIAQWVDSFTEVAVEKIDSVLPKMHSYEKNE